MNENIDIFKTEIVSHPGDGYRLNLCLGSPNREDRCFRIDWGTDYELLQETEARLRMHIDEAMTPLREQIEELGKQLNRSEQSHRSLEEQVAPRNTLLGYYRKFVSKLAEDRDKNRAWATAKVWAPSDLWRGIGFDLEEEHQQKSFLFGNDA